MLLRGLYGVLQGSTQGFLCSGFSAGYSGFCHCCTGALYCWTGCCITGQTPLMQWLDVIIAKQDHHWEYRWSSWPRYVVGTCLLSIHIRLIRQNRFKPLALGLAISCYDHKTECWRPACCWLRWGSMSIGYPNRTSVGVGVIKSALYWLNIRIVITNVWLLRQTKGIISFNRRWTTG